MSRCLTSFQCIVAALITTVLQIAVVLAFVKTDGSFGDRYLALVQHDSYWFANIVDRGYGTIVPPIERKEMEVSNVAFFPAYPILTGVLKWLTGLSTAQSLLIIAQAAAWGFWTYFFLFCQRWKLGLRLQIFGALAIGLHPVAFFLVAGYSESLFLVSLAGFIYWTMSNRRGATTLAIIHGMVMSGTRIVGLPCAIFPLALAWYQKGRVGDESVGQGFARFRKPILVTFLSLLGGLAFFAYCQVRWSRWDLYMLTQSEGWAIEPDYLAVFKPRNYHFAFPPLYDGRAASQFASALAAVIFILVAMAELIRAWLGRHDWRERFGFYLSAGIIYYISVSGVASVGLESMLRYHLCVHAFIVLAALHFLRDLRFGSRSARVFATVIVGLLLATGFGLQGYYVWNFTQGNWIA